MVINPNEVSYKKKVGKSKDGTVFEIGLKGGLCLHYLVNGKKSSVIAAAPHPAISRHLSSKRHSDIEWTELNKAEWVDPEHFQDLIPKYEALTDALRERQGLK